MNAGTAVSVGFIGIRGDARPMGAEASQSGDGPEAIGSMAI